MEGIQFEKIQGCAIPLNVFSQHSDMKMVTTY